MTLVWFFFAPAFSNYHIPFGIFAISFYHSLVTVIMSGQSYYDGELPERNRSYGSRVSRHSRSGRHTSHSVADPQSRARPRRESQEGGRSRRPSSEQPAPPPHITRRESRTSANRGPAPDEPPPLRRSRNTIPVTQTETYPPETTPPPPYNPLPIIQDDGRDAATQQPVASTINAETQPGLEPVEPPSISG